VLFLSATLQRANKKFYDWWLCYDKLFSPQMVVTVNTTKYTIENDVTKKE